MSDREGFRWVEIKAWGEVCWSRLVSPGHLGRDRRSARTLFVLPGDWCDDDSNFTQGLNVFQRIALVSQFFTVFGSIMFVMQEAVAQTSGKAEDVRGKLMVINRNSIVARESGTWLCVLEL